MRISDWSSDVCSSDLGGLARGCLEVDGEHALVAVVVDEQRPAGMGVAGDVALDRLDLDDLCPQIGEQLARIGAAHHRPHLDNPSSLQQRYHHPLLQVFFSLLRQYCPITDLSENAPEWRLEQ